MADNNTRTNPAEPLGLLSLNANGLGEAKNRLNLIEWVNKFHNGQKKIILLQETHSTERVEEDWRKEWGFREIVFSHGTSGSKGVAIIFPKHIKYSLEAIKRSQDGRYVSVNVTIDNNKLCIINCYAPNTTKLKDQLKWLEQIQSILLDNSDRNIILGGDLNNVFIPHLDRYKCKPGVVETEYVKAWKLLCAEMNLADVWRILNPDKRGYTWRQGKSASNLRQSRLDYWLVSINLMYDLSTVEIRTSIRSDHSMIGLEFYKTEEAKRGPSFWRFNASLLKEK
jgi:exonuclease III